MAKVVIYARVSTQGQDYERQLAELREYARKMEYEVVMEFCEKVSGAKTVAERQALTELLSFVESNKVDKVLIYECSRLSRRAIDFLTVIENLTAKKISVYILQNGLETLLPNGQLNPIAQLVMGILAQFNSMERSLIRSRMESGYNHYRSIGGKVVFEDMIHYTTVKTNMFNGISHPSIALLHQNGELEVYKVFRYEDYRDRMC